MFDADQGRLPVGTQLERDRRYFRAQHRSALARAAQVAVDAQAVRDPDVLSLLAAEGRRLREIAAQWLLLAEQLDAFLSPPAYQEEALL